MEDKRIELKEELIKKAKEMLKKVETSDVSREFQDLKKKWRKTLHEEESLKESELEKEFDALVSKINEKVGIVVETVEERKNRIIEEAKKALDNNSIKQTGVKMDELLEAWKQSGRGQKEKDDEQWAQFKEIRDQFYQKRKEHYAQLKENFANNKKAKEALIEEAIKTNEGDNFKEIDAKFNELMEAWKKVGRTSKEFEDELWKKFKNERNKFYKNRRAYYENMKETFAKRVEEKKALIDEAKLYLARCEFTDEEKEAVKALRTKWKEIGNAGRENEDTLWEEFNTRINKYYENMREYKK